MTTPRSRFDDQQATTVESARALELGRLALVVVIDGQAVAHDLPARGTVVIGRGDRSDVAIDHPSVSRLHARLHLDGEVILEEAGSTNGTRAGGRLLAAGERVALAAGEAFVLGDVTLLLQDLGQLSRRRRVWDHAYFENRTEEECHRCDASGGGFAVVHLHAVPAGDLDRTLVAFAAVLRPADVLGHYGPGEFEALMPGCDRADADRRVQRIEHELALAGVAARTGVATFPADGTDHHGLAARALSRLRNLDTFTGEVRVVVGSALMREVHGLIERVAPSDISVLLLGETGVGKEVIADTLVRRSRRADAPFVRLNCAALTESLLESELFGHERGAFTGAAAAKPGLLESATTGTVLLDEVGELPMTVQVKLLRVLEERAVTRVGGLTPQPLDVRFIAATNRDLQAEVASGRFREDLFYRLAGVTITIPPLRDRLEELEPLARLFIASFCRRNQLTSAPHLSARAAEVLRAHHWPGNLRELRNLIERAVLLTQGPLILPEHLPVPLTATAPAARASLGATAPALPTVPTHAAAPPADPGAAVLDERARIVAALDACAGNQTRAAQALGISRRTLVYRLDLYGLTRPRKPAGR